MMEGSLPRPIWPMIFRSAKKNGTDGAIPSANAVAFDNLMRLSRLTGDAMLEEEASACARFIAGAAARSPSAVAGFLAALACSPQTGAAQDLVIAGDPAHPAPVHCLTRRAPGTSRDCSSCTAPRERPGEEVETVAPAARGRVAPDGRAMAYLCSGSTCLVPVNTPEELLNNLRGGKGRKATP